MPQFDKSALAAAAIAAVSRVAGAIGGVALTNNGNRALQEGQQRAAARGAARVYQAQFGAAQLYLRYMIHSQHFIPAPPERLAIPPAEGQLIATRMNAATWRDVQYGELTYHLMLQRYRTDLKRAATSSKPRRLSARQRANLMRVEKAVSGAIAALAGLAGTPG